MESRRALITWLNCPGRSITGLDSLNRITNYCSPLRIPMGLIYPRPSMGRKGTYIYLHECLFLIAEYGKCRQIYQSHRWHGHLPIHESGQIV